jgi:hypothetical protein
MSDAHGSKFHRNAHAAYDALLRLEGALGSRKAVGALFQVNGDTIGAWLATKVPMGRVNDILEAARSRGLL